MATMVVVVAALVIVAALILLWFRDRRSLGSTGAASSVSVSSVPPQATLSRPISQPPRAPAAPSTSEIAWGVCGGLWLFVLTTGMVGLVGAAVVGFALHARG